MSTKHRLIYHMLPTRERPALREPFSRVAQSTAWQHHNKYSACYYRREITIRFLTLIVITVNSGVIKGSIQCHSSVVFKVHNAVTYSVQYVSIFFNTNFACHVLGARIYSTHFRWGGWDVFKKFSLQSCTENNNPSRHIFGRPSPCPTFFS